MITPKIAPWKRTRVDELAEILGSDGVIGIVDIDGVPAKNMLDMRASLRSKLTITMAKKTLIRRAWESSGMESETLDQLFESSTQPAVVHTDSMNAFELSAELSKTRQGRAAKEGELAPMDIIVEKGPTQFGPGPIVGEFNAVGIPAKIDKGKVAIQKTVTAVEKGQPISADLGIMLSKLDINPIEIGIILTGAMEDGLVLMADDLDINVDDVRNDVISAVSGAFNLACQITYFTPQTVPSLIAKAKGEAMSVAVNSAIVNDETSALILSKAKSQALGLAGQLDSIALDEEIVAMLNAGATISSESSNSSDSSSDDGSSDATSEEEEEEEEDAGFGGLGDLFG
jgi:large subunit ribosomal protein L10